MKNVVEGAGGPQSNSFVILKVIGSHITDNARRCSYAVVMTQASGTTAVTPHPKGKKARVLLSSVFGPYARDDEFGSRAINPMELYHNQVTRAQGSFSLRMFHRSWGDRKSTRLNSSHVSES